MCFHGRLKGWESEKRAEGNMERMHVYAGTPRQCVLLIGMLGEGQNIQIYVIPSQYDETRRGIFRGKEEQGG